MAKTALVAPCVCSSRGFVLALRPHGAARSGRRGICRHCRCRGNCSSPRISVAFNTPAGVRAFSALAWSCSCAVAYVYPLQLFGCWFFGNNAFRSIPKPDCRNNNNLFDFSFRQCLACRTTIEPFALNILQASIVLYVVYRLSTDPLWGRGKVILFLLLGVIYGTGVCNHHSLALTFPLAVVALVNNRTNLLQAGGLLVFGTIIGMAPLAYFFIPQQPGVPVWGDWSNPWQRLPVHLLRTEFGTTKLFFSAHGSWLAGPLAFMRTLPVGLSIVPFFLAVMGVASFRPHRITKILSVKVFWSGVAFTFLLSGIIFPALFRLDNSGTSNVIAARFFSLPTLYLAFPLLYGLIIVFKRIQSPIVQGSFAVALIGLHLVYQWPDAERRHQTFFENHIRNIITVAEPNAIIIGSSDQDYTMGLYARQVLGAHDMSFVFINLINLAWYQSSLVKELGLVFPRHCVSVEDVCKLLLEKNPVYIHSLPPKELLPLLKHSYPIGPLARLQKDNDIRPDARSLFYLNENLFKNRLVLPSSRQINVHYPWDDALLDCYAQTWHSIGVDLIAKGDSVLADRARAYQIFFTPPASANKK